LIAYDAVLADPDAPQTRVADERAGARGSRLHSKAIDGPADPSGDRLVELERLLHPSYWAAYAMGSLTARGPGSPRQPAPPSDGRVEVSQSLRGDAPVLAVNELLVALHQIARHDRGRAAVSAADE
jgi:hypothetical protein